MSFREKSILITIVAMLVAVAGYVAALAASSAGAPIADIPYQGPMIVAVAVLVIVTVAGHVVVAIHDPSEASSPADERERLIQWRGQSMGGYVLAVGVFVALCLAMAEVPWFWIANVLAGMWVLSEVFAGMAKLVLFRRGV